MSEEARKLIEEYSKSATRVTVEEISQDDVAGRIVMLAPIANYVTTQSKVGESILDALISTIDFASKKKYSTPGRERSAMGRRLMGELAKRNIEVRG